MRVKKFIVYIVLAVLAFLSLCLVISIIESGGWSLFVIRMTMNSDLPEWVKSILWGWR